jgi:hypothetical protein
VVAFTTPPFAMAGVATPAMADCVASEMVAAASSGTMKPACRLPSVA